MNQQDRLLGGIRLQFSVLRNHRGSLMGTTPMNNTDTGCWLSHPVSRRSWEAQRLVNQSDKHG